MKKNVSQNKIRDNTKVCFFAIRGLNNFLINIIFSYFHGLIRIFPLTGITVTIYYLNKNFFTE